MTVEKLNGAHKANSNGEFGPYLSQGLERPLLKDKKVLQAMSRVPRHRFVPQGMVDVAYEDRALPIGNEQTISQPYIVALMTQESGACQGAKILEIGTGSGFQAAVLSEMGAYVYSIEIVQFLALQSKERLAELGYKNVFVKHGDGWEGWEEEAPFDAILVTASAPSPPPKLLAQLAHRGKMVIPIENDVGDSEILMVIERDGDDFITRELGAVRFVPITGKGREP